MTDRPYLPDCICKTRSEDERCPIHAPGQRGREQRRASRAVKAGKISKEAYEMWLAKYRRKVTRLFGSIKTKGQRQ